MKHTQNPNYMITQFPTIFYNHYNNLQNVLCVSCKNFNRHVCYYNIKFTSQKAFTLPYLTAVNKYAVRELLNAYYSLISEAVHRKETLSVAQYQFSC
jgi:hypothetical protein